MPSRKYTSEYLKAEMAGWNKSIALPHLTEEEKSTFRKRKLAIEMYAQGYPVKDIKERTGVGRPALHKLLAKCMKVNAETGEAEGFNALVPYVRTETKKGKMEEFIDGFEGLEEKLVGFYFSLNPKIPIKFPNKETAYSYFATCLMKDYGVGEGEYPFTLSDGGKRLFSKWLDKKEEEKQLYLARQKKEAKIEDKSTGPEGPMLRPSRPYEIVEIDGHRLDFIYAGIHYDMNGNEHVSPAGRPWLLAAIDGATKCILSYRIVFSEEYDGMDVMKLIEGITLPYKDVQGVREDGMPSQNFEEVRYALPELILLDNALSHYRKDLTDKTAEFGYAFAFGPVADPTKRPNIERFFGIVETRWGHKIPSTTGSNPFDILRVNAEKNAVDYRFTSDKVEKFMALAIAEYNNTPSKGLGGMTPIGRMRFLLNKGLFPSTLAPRLRDDFRLYCWRKAVFRGNKKTGKQIYVQTDNYIYSSNEIKNVYTLAGSPVILKKDPDNIVVIYAFTEQGRYLGPLYMKAGTKMIGKVTMKQGREAHKYLKDHDIKPTYGMDDVLQYIMMLEKEPTGKNNLKKLERVSASITQGYDESELEKVSIQEEPKKEPPVTEEMPSFAPIDGEFDARDLYFDNSTHDERRKARRKKYMRR